MTRVALPPGWVRRQYGAVAPHEGSKYGWSVSDALLRGLSTILLEDIPLVLARREPYIVAGSGFLQVHGEPKFLAVVVPYLSWRMETES